MDDIHMDSRKFPSTFGMRRKGDGRAMRRPRSRNPRSQKIVRKRTTAPPPDQPVQQAQPTQTTQQQTQGAFPAPMPSGSFSR